MSVQIRRGDPTLLLLHGLAGYGGEWSAMTRLFPAEFGVIMPDQRGHGASFDGNEVDVTPPSWVGDAVACMELHDGAPLTVVGQSMGALVAMRLAASHPELVSNLVLVEAGIDAIGDREIEGLSAWFDSWPPVFATRRDATEFFGVDERSTKAWVGGLAKLDQSDRGEAGMAARFDPATMISAMRELAGSDRHDIWSEISIPTAVVRASTSAIADGDVAAMAKARPDVEVITIAGGHDLHLDEPEIMASVVARIATEGIETDG